MHRRERLVVNRAAKRRFDGDGYVYNSRFATGLEP